MSYDPNQPPPPAAPPPPMAPPPAAPPPPMAPPPAAPPPPMAPPPVQPGAPLAGPGAMAGPNFAKPAPAPPAGPPPGAPAPPQMSSPPLAPAAGAPMMTGSVDTMLSEFSPRPPGARFTLQNHKLLRVTLGPDVLSAKGAMVAYQGQVNFDHQGQGMKGFMKKALTGEGMSLMRINGQGDVYFAVDANDIVIITLNGDALTLNGSAVLAFDATLHHDIKMTGGLGGSMAQGAFNVYLQGQGQVAIMTRGEPVVLWTHQAPTFVDTNAVVAWSANLQTSLANSMTFNSLIGRGSGEAFQMAFHGQGWVLVQPDEGFGTRGGIGGGGASGGGAQINLGGLLRG